MAKKKNICIRLTEEKMEVLKENAKRNNMSINAYAVSKLFDGKDTSLLALIGMEKENQEIEPRDQNVKVMLSKSELEYVKKQAGMMSVSAFIRKVLLEAGNERFTFEIMDGDLDDLKVALTEFNMRLNGIIGALKFRTELYRSDIVNMEKMLAEVNENIKLCIKNLLADRKYIRKKGIEHLKSQINKRILS